MFEYMASGVLIISSDLPALREVLWMGKTPSWCRLQLARVVEHWIGCPLMFLRNSIAQSSPSRLQGAIHMGRAGTGYIVPVELKKKLFHSRSFTNPDRSSC